VGTSGLPGGNDWGGGSSPGANAWDQEEGEELGERELQ